MALQQVHLDTLTWDQMVTAIRTRIPADSQGQWTLHAPVDPGVTLLELFAWLLEQRLYWMDQIPDSLVQGILMLMGQEPKPAQPAVTLIRLHDTARVPGRFTVAPAGTVMRLLDQNPPILFRLTEQCTLFPLLLGKNGQSSPEALRIFVNGIERTRELKRGAIVSINPSTGNSATLEILLTLAEPIASSAAGGRLTLLVELENPAAIQPEWLATPDTQIAAPASLHWQYTNGGQGQTAEFPAPGSSDGTGGLRRSGIVRLAIPADWQAEPSASAGGPTYKVKVEIKDAHYTVWPRLVRITPNVAPAVHAWPRVKHPKTRGWLPLPGNVIALASVPSDSALTEYPPLEDTVKVRVLQADSRTPGEKWDEWNRVHDLAFYGPADQVFVVDRPRGEIRFGDGLTGRLPVLPQTADSEIEVSYQAGGGPAGNIGAWLDWQVEQLPPHGPATPFAGTNVTKGEGGKENESLSEARQRSAAALQERNRAVTAQDYQNLVQTTPGAGFRRAFARVGYAPDFPCQSIPGVTSVFVVPYAPRECTDGPIDPEFFIPAPQPDPAALESARSRLQSARLLGSQVFVLPPAYRSVWLEIDVAANSAIPASLREQVAWRLRTFFDPLEGGTDGSGWPFGDPLRPSALLREAQTVLGDLADVQKVQIVISGRDGAESCEDVPIGPHELLKLERVQVRVTSQAAITGGLR